MASPAPSPAPATGGSLRPTGSSPAARWRSSHGCPSLERRDLATRALCGAIAAWFGIHPSALALLDGDTLTRMAGRLEESGPPPGRDLGEIPMCVDIGGFRLDRAARAVRVGGRAVDLTAREFDLLAVLVSRPGLVLTRTGLLRRVWGPGVLEDSSTLCVYIRRLRVKLGGVEGLPFRISTIRGCGYRIDVLDGCGAVAGPREARQPG
jgi:Transcriptional regulatory protein, C terminal